MAYLPGYLLGSWQLLFSWCAMLCEATPDWGLRLPKEEASGLLDRKLAHSHIGAGVVVAKVNERSRPDDPHGDEAKEEKEEEQ